jgi:serine protease AprX
MRSRAPHTLRRSVALALVVWLAALPAHAGVVIRGTQGVTLTGIDGVYYDNTAGVTLTGIDGFLGLNVNGIFQTQSDGVTLTGIDGVTLTGIDGVAYTGSNSYAATHADGLTANGADGVTLTGIDGVTLTGIDGQTWTANSVVIRDPNGVTLTGIDGVTLTGIDGLQMVGEDGASMTSIDGVTLTGIDSVRVNSSGQIVATSPDGTVFVVPADGVTLTGIDGGSIQGLDGVTLTGIDGWQVLSLDGLPVADLDAQAGGPLGSTGLLSFDPELALFLDRLTDDSNVSAVLIYHRPVTDADIADLQRIGVRGGTRFRALPMVTVTATKKQLDKIGDLPGLLNIYGNRTLEWNADLSREQSGLWRARGDADLLRANNFVPFEGDGVAVAVLDTGLDAAHADLAGRVLRNVKLADLAGANLLGFRPPDNVDSLTSTDTAAGHGTFVGGIIAGNGARSAGRFKGFAPRARLVGLSAGDASLFNVLAGFDYLLSNPSLGVRVVNCSFSANTVYDRYDPVNVATKMLTERGVNVVFSAGNSGPGLHTLNPYAAAPWVISVGATAPNGRLADFSSRGDFGSRKYRPTLVAPGTDVVSLRAAGTNLTGVTGIVNADREQLDPAALPYYTTASGTSFSAPQVVGTIALMLDANPNLSTAEVRDILQRTATPLPPYYTHEVGAGMLNAHAAVLEAAFPSRQIGLFRSVMSRGQVRFVREPPQTFTATLVPGGQHDVSLRVPANAVFASTQVAWGPIASPNDLSLKTLDPAGNVVGSSNYLNLPGLTGKRERTLVGLPSAGTWRARIMHTLGLGTTPQEFRGVFETARIEYAALADVDGLDAATRAHVRDALRALTMWPEGGRFHPSRAVTRAELAAAVVAAGRAPQYVPDTPSFTDVFDTPTMNAAESARAFFPGAIRGTAFLPDERADRLLAAIVLVRAAGLESEAQAHQATPTGFADEESIPAEWRGHAYVAFNRGLLPAGPSFDPAGTFTRAQLAQALAALSGFAPF